MLHLFADPSDVQDELLTITGPEVNHIRNVMRLKPGEEISVSIGGDGKEYRYGIESYTEDSVLCRLRFVKDKEVELPVKVLLFQGLPKADKMDLIVQKAVELGVYEIVPVMMKRCVVKLSEEKKIQKKTQRWQAIAESAAKQCDRGIVPVVHAPVTMEQAFDMASTLEYNMIPYELQDGIQVSRQIVEEACSRQSVGIFIGPEGGLEKDEVEKAMEIGVKPITLGKRILRTETAGMALISIMMFQLQK